ncbi:hypothetical protein ACWGR4_28745 [Embleya sp. NPDC055664]
MGLNAYLCSPAESGFTGTTGLGEPLESLEFIFSGPTVMQAEVRVHLAGMGWGSWKEVKSNYSIRFGAPGTAGPAIEAISFRSTNGTFEGAGHIMNNPNWVGTGLLSDITIGTTGEGRWLEAFWVVPHY